MRFRRTPSQPGSPIRPEGLDPGATAEEIVVIDDRERASGLAEHVTRMLGRPPVVRRLEAGDVLIRKRILIERKTAADFAASITDGRLFSQSESLIRQKFEPLILIEGSFREKNIRLSGPALRQALIALALDWRIPVLRSASIEDTAQWIAELTGGRRRKREPPDWRRITPSGARRPASTQPKAPEKPPIDPRVRSRRQTQALLAAIEGVGPVRAGALAERFGSLAGVIGATHDELARVPGVGSRLAARIREALEGKVSGDRPR